MLVASSRSDVFKFKDGRQDHIPRYRISKVASVSESAQYPEGPVSYNCEMLMQENL
jgi:hypothetical protein